MNKNTVLKVLKSDRETWSCRPLVPPPLPAVALLVLVRHAAALPVVISILRHVCEEFAHTFLLDPHNNIVRQKRELRCGVFYIKTRESVS